MTASGASESPTSATEIWSSTISRLRWAYRGAIHNESETDIWKLQPRTSVGYVLIMIGWPLSMVLGFITAQPEWVTGSLKFALALVYGVSTTILYTGVVLVLFSGIRYIIRK